MTSGRRLSERDRCIVLRMWSQRRFSKSEIARACDLSRPVVIRIIDDYAAWAWVEAEKQRHLDDLCNRDQF